MELQALSELLKLVPEGLSAVVVILFVLYKIYTKNQESSLTAVTEIGNLQANQLTTLIDQNIKLAEELHSVRTELTAAYDIITDMRSKIAKLEEMIELVKKKGE